VQPRRPPAHAGAFEQFQASELFCARCRASRPVRERLLLVLPEGDLYEYLCTRCGNSVGTRKVAATMPGVLVP
jgi:hypothetical protein